MQAASDPIRATSLDNGSFRFAQGRTARLLDLGASLSGCRKPLRDGVSGRQEQGSVQARVLDMVWRTGFWYVVMQVDTNANCNVQGAGSRRGAGPRCWNCWGVLWPSNLVRRAGTGRRGAGPLRSDRRAPERGLNVKSGAQP